MDNPATIPSPAAQLTDYVNLDSLHGAWNEGMLILMYHAIEAPTPGMPWANLYVDPIKLRDQMAELIGTGANFIRADDMIASTSRERQVLVTLDDGFRNVYENALPVFQELKIPAISYIVAGQFGGSNVWDHAKGLLQRPLMTREEILNWVAAGLEIGAHTLTHPSLTSISHEQARTEIFDSKKILEDLIGKPVDHFCYPYGDLNGTVRGYVQEAGYKTATSCKVGFNLPETNRFILRRLMARQ